MHRATIERSACLSTSATPKRRLRWACLRARKLESRGVHRAFGIPGEARSSVRPRIVAGVVGAVCLAAGAHDARADYEFQTGVGVGGAWLRQTPALTSKPVTTAAREMREGELAVGGGLALFGFSGDVDLTIDDRWKVPLFGGALFWAVGSYDAVVTSVDGSIARVRPWTALRGDVLLPGVGRRWKHRRNMVAVALRTGVSFVGMGGSVAAATDWAPLTLRSTTFLLQAEVEACRRLDPTTRVCLQVVPRIYDHELLNGVVFGLRMEWGP